MSIRRLHQRRRGTRAVALVAGDNVRQDQLLVDLLTTAGNTNSVIVLGTITTGSGPISIRSDDDLTVPATGLIGGPAYSGKIALFANFDGANSQSFVQIATAAVTIETTSSAADAITINVSGSTRSGVLI